VLRRAFKCLIRAKVQVRTDSLDQFYWQAFHSRNGIFWKNFGGFPNEIMTNAAATEINWKNVGNWHWVDKNCVNWATEYFQTSLDAAVESQVIKVTFDKISGDCDLNQRKSQVISIFDLCIKGNWTITEKGKELWKGSIEIPEFMHDTTMDELVVNLDIESTAKESQDIKNKVRQHVTPLIREKFSHFAADLMLAHSKDVYITQDEMKGHPVKQQYNPKPPVSQVDQTSTAKPDSQLGGLVTVTQTVSFQATAKDLYDVLLNPKKVTVWTRAPCTIEKTVGSSFSLFGGNITGKIIELVSYNLKNRYKMRKSS
jgi:activator of HSP90 ATPase